jgi:hypothetical protein
MARNKKSKKKSKSSQIGTSPKKPARSDAGAPEDVILVTNVTYDADPGALSNRSADVSTC